MKTSLFFNSQSQKQSQQFLEESYFQFLSEVREDVSQGETSDFLSEDFQKDFQSLINREELNEFSAKNFYWLNLIDSLVDTLFILEEADFSVESIMEYFEASEFLGYIITELEADEAPEIVITNIKDIQEFQIVSFFNLHISQKKWNPSGPVAYRPVPELGEGPHGLYLGTELDYYALPEDLDPTALPVIEFNPMEKTLQIDLEEEVLVIQGVANPSLQYKNQKLFLLSNAELENSEKKQALVDKFLKANEIIESLTPELKECLVQFTNYVVPLDAEELVSYSMKVLPRYSSINIFNRDLVDLVDDLLHENGHHFLNGLLEGEEELMFEDDDKIFYSPWRRALRPVRGLYHAVLTFYWAYRLFKELALSDSLSQYFTAEEIEKINFRLLEEETMILACREDLDKAHELEKITDFGKTFYMNILEEMEADRDLCSSIEEKLTETQKEALQTLKTEIEIKGPVTAG